MCMYAQVPAKHTCTVLTSTVHPQLSDSHLFKFSLILSKLLKHNNIMIVQYIQYDGHNICPCVHNAVLWLIRCGAKEKEYAASSDK